MDSALVTLLVDSFPKILIPGLAVTLPLAIASFACALVIAVVTALVQYANVPIAKQIARPISGSCAARRSSSSSTSCISACPTWV